MTDMLLEIPGTDLDTLVDPYERPAVPGRTPKQEAAEAIAPDGYHLTDAGNAQRFIDLSDGKVRYAHEWRRWLVYRGGRWTIDAGDAMVTEAAKSVSRALMDLVPTAGRDRKAVLAAAIRAESATAITAMIKLARAIPGVIVNHEDFDTNPTILNVLNGTIDLRSMTLRPHDPDDLCTQQCPVAWDPDATAPLWGSCLETWQPDPEIREYFQREIGAGATGYSTEILSVWTGTGGNGKSAAVSAIQHVLGPYSAIPHKSLLVVNRHEQHATVVASMFRVRWAVASETSAGDKLSEEQVKNLTGSDRLRARRMREDEWSFGPTHTLVMVTNYLPEISGQDEGIWRRVRLIPWDVTIPTADRDDRLGEKLNAEARGILRWIVEGASRYLAEGIGAPEKIVARTNEYRADEDTVGRFIEDSGLVFGPKSEIDSGDLRRLHEQWCEDAGEDHKRHIVEVTAGLKARGCTAARGNRGRYWIGVGRDEGTF